MAEISHIVLYILFVLIILASLGSWMARSCVMGVLYLALVFILVAFFFFIIGAEFLAILLLVIYSGAIILLFLFVIFLLNLRVVELHSHLLHYLPIGAFISLFFLLIITFSISNTITVALGSAYAFYRWEEVLLQDTNMALFGYIIYEHLGIAVLLIALILLAVMLSIVVLSVGMKKKEAPFPRALEPSTMSQSTTTLWRKNAKNSSRK